MKIEFKVTSKSDKGWFESWGSVDSEKLNEFGPIPLELEALIAAQISAQLQPARTTQI